MALHKGKTEAKRRHDCALTMFASGLSIMSLEDKAPSRTVGASEASPIFLHGPWRCGSTYYWSRFRALPETMAFYEPLHHGLAKLTPERIGRAGVQTTSANGHPHLEAPYFAEFEPVISRFFGRARGVRDYRSSFAHRRFNLDPHDSHDMLERYLARLIGHARAQGQRPVLGCNRTCGKVGWIKARFDSYDIYIDREPAAIWASYEAERAQGNYTFFSMWLRVLETNANDPVWRPLAERLGVAPLDRLKGPMKVRHRAMIDAMGPAETYLMTFYAWMACAARAAPDSDIIIDDALASLPHYAKRIAAEVRHATGLDIDLSGLEARQPRTTLCDTVRKRVEHEAFSHFPRIVQRPQAGLWRRLAELSGRKADLIGALI